MTDRERNTIHVVLEQCDGNREMAAEILGLTAVQLKNKIHASPPLKKAWASGAVAAPTVEETLSRPVILTSDQVAEQNLIKREDELTVAISKEDALLRKGLKGLKLSEDEINLSVSLQVFHNQSFSQAADLVSGGVTMTAIKILGEIQELKERLDAGFGDSETALAEEQMVRDSMHKFIDQLAKIKGLVDEGAYKKAIIELKKKEGAKGPGRGKPGFQPLQAKPVVATQTNIHVHTSPGATVQAHEIKTEKQITEAATEA